MNRPRLIPCLLLNHGVIIRSEGFKVHPVIGNPMSTIERFSHWNVDELILLDNEATGEGRTPDAGRVTEICDESLMPVAVGGGLRDVEAVRGMLACGADKVVLNTAALEVPGLVADCAAKFGSQCVVVSLDARRGGDGYEVFTHGGSRGSGRTPREVAVALEEQGAGEILINSIQRDGSWEGYDLELVSSVAAAVGVPVIALGGAGSVEDLGRAVNQAGASAVSAGSLFVYHGRRRGILITFPTQQELTDALGPDSVRERV